MAKKVMFATLKGVGGEQLVFVSAATYRQLRDLDLIGRSCSEQEADCCREMFRLCGLSFLDELQIYYRQGRWGLVFTLDQEYITFKLLSLAKEEVRAAHEMLLKAVYEMGRAAEAAAE